MQKNREKSGQQESRPLVAIGMPLYNNAETIESAVRSLMRQSWGNIEIIISDDGSSDQTLEICRRLAREDARIKLFRQDRNLYYQNFWFVLNQTTADYFMWAAGDDYWRPGFVEGNMNVLLRRDDVVASVSRCLFVQQGRVLGLAEGTYPLLGEKWANIEAYLRNPVDNTRMYGIFRRAALLRSFPRNSFHAYDWALSAATLKFGKHYQVDRILMRRDKTPTENYCHTVNRDHRFFLFRYFPVLRMTLHLLFVARIPLSAGIVRALLKLNWVKHQKYMEVVKPALFAKLAPYYLALNRRFIERL